MTIDCDERREAAAEFRRAAREQYEFDGENFLDCVGTYLGDAYTDGAAWARLADLIDPTCEDVSEPPESGGFWPAPHFKCSVCGTQHVSVGYVRYCPNCGARVVSVDE